jgi:iron(III) transport system substrate-binding protein
MPLAFKLRGVPFEHLVENSKALVRTFKKRRTMMKLNVYFSVLAFSVVLILPGISLSQTKKITTVAELALYNGPDRQQILEEGAKKEGKLSIYTSSFNVQYIAKAFEKKYPYIKVDIWYGDESKALPRVFEEYRAKRVLSDVVGLTQEGTIAMLDAGLLQPFYSPEVPNIMDDAVTKSPAGGVLAVGHYSNGRGIGYNTKMITKEELPKTYRDLLNPKWKGKLPIGGSTAGVGWMGVQLDTYGEDFVVQLAKQDFQVHMISVRALLDMIVKGEYAFSPTIADSHVDLAQRKGAPVDWMPIEPVHCFLGQLTLHKLASHPHAALLYIDFDLRKENAEIFVQEGYFSTRKDIPLKRSYKAHFGPFSSKQMKQWDTLFNKLFVKK